MEEQLFDVGKDVERFVTQLVLYEELLKHAVPLCKPKVGFGRRFEVGFIVADERGPKPLSSRRDDVRRFGISARRVVSEDHPPTAGGTYAVIGNNGDRGKTMTCQHAANEHGYAGAQDDHGDTFQAASFPKRDEGFVEEKLSIQYCAGGPKATVDARGFHGNALAEGHRPQSTRLTNLCKDISLSEMLEQCHEHISVSDRTVEIAENCEGIHAAMASC
jgi:hypothetical protein